MSALGSLARTVATVCVALEVKSAFGQWPSANGARAYHSSTTTSTPMFLESAKFIKSPHAVQALPFDKSSPRSEKSQSASFAPSSPVCSQLKLKRSVTLPLASCLARRAYSLFSTSDERGDRRQEENRGRSPHRSYHSPFTPPHDRSVRRHGRPVLAG